MFAVEAFRLDFIRRSTSMPDTNARPRQTGAVINRDLGDEHLFYDGEGDRLHVLNGTARDIYRMCDGSRTLEEIARALTDKYEVDVESALADVRATVGQLVELGILAA
jgi:pyrroloquinoline quinone biosynthesis protein D